MTEIAERREQAEQQDRQGLLKDLFKTVREKAFPLKKEIVPTYEGELINGIFASGITIKSSHARLEQRGVTPLIEICSANDKSAAEVLFINIEKLGIMLTIWKKRDKGLIPKHTYILTTQGSGKEYQEFLDKNHGNHLDVRSIEDIREFTNNLRCWKKT